MSRSQRVQVLVAQSIRFWLPLLLLALGFWGAGRFITLQILNQSNDTPRVLIANAQTGEAPPVQVTAVSIKIDRQRGLSWATVNLSNSTLKELAFEFPLTDPRSIEAAIAQELELSPLDIKELAKYRIIDR